MQMCLHEPINCCQEDVVLCFYNNESISVGLVIKEKKSFLSDSD